MRTSPTFQGAKLCSGLLLGGAALLIVRPALADDKPTLSGSWSASALSESWSTKDWADQCGPKPTSQGAPGGTVTIAEQGGELAINGAGRSYSTVQCWEQMPGLTRNSHSSGKRGWTTRCISAPGDPRHATVVTNISATDDTIVLAEQGDYQGFIEGATCHATVSRSRSFKLIKRADDTSPSASATPSAGPAPSSRPPAPAPTPPADCGEVGAPVRFEVRPSKKLSRPGEIFTFRAGAFDEKGCRVNLRSTFRKEDADSTALTVDEAGKVSVAVDAKEGTYVVLAEFGGKTIKLNVEVAATDRYDALLKERGLNDSGEDDRAASVDITNSVGASETKADDGGARARKQTFIGVVLGVSALLGLIGLVVMRRGRRPAPPRDSRPSGDGTDHGKESTDGLLSEREEEDPVSSSANPLPPETATCPVCGKEFPKDGLFCPEDGAPLKFTRPAAVEARVAPPAKPTSQSGPEKICPVCGDRFPEDATFCGKDGSSLVPIN